MSLTLFPDIYRLIVFLMCLPNFRLICKHSPYIKGSGFFLSYKYFFHNFVYMPDGFPDSSFVSLRAILSSTIRMFFLIPWSVLLLPSPWTCRCFCLERWFQLLKNFISIIEYCSLGTTGSKDSLPKPLYTFHTH